MGAKSKRWGKCCLDIPFHGVSAAQIPRVLPVGPPRAPGCARCVLGLVSTEHQHRAQQDVALLDPCQARLPALLPTPSVCFSTEQPVLHICRAQLAETLLQPSLLLPCLRCSSNGMSRSFPFCGIGS